MGCRDNLPHSVQKVPYFAVLPLGTFARQLVPIDVVMVSPTCFETQAIGFTGSGSGFGESSGRFMSILFRMQA